MASSIMRDFYKFFIFAFLAGLCTSCHRDVAINPDVVTVNIVPEYQDIINKRIISVRVVNNYPFAIEFSSSSWPIDGYLSEWNQESNIEIDGIIYHAHGDVGYNPNETIFTLRPGEEISDFLTYDTFGIPEDKFSSCKILRMNIVAIRR